MQHKLLQWFSLLQRTAIDMRSEEEHELARQIEFIMEEIRDKVDTLLKIRLEIQRKEPE